MFRKAWRTVHCGSSRKPRIHHVNRARDLPEEARIRLHRDLRFFFESGSPPRAWIPGRKGFSIRGFFSRLWEKIEDF